MDIKWLKLCHFAVTAYNSHILKNEARKHNLKPRKITGNQISENNKTKNRSQRRT